MQRISTKTRDNARSLRKEMTFVEQKLWYKIRKRQLKGVRFRRQHPIGNYIVDFISLEEKLIIELDGGQHMEQKRYDIQRDRFLTDKGFKVIRFWNNEVLNNINSVLQIISDKLPPS